MSSKAESTGQLNCISVVDFVMVKGCRWMGIIMTFDIFAKQYFPTSGRYGSAMAGY